MAHQREQRSDQVVGVVVYEPQPALESSERSDRNSHDSGSHEKSIVVMGLREREANLRAVLAFSASSIPGSTDAIDPPSHHPATPPSHLVFATTWI